MPGNFQIGFLFPRILSWINKNIMRSKEWVEFLAHQTVLSLHFHLGIPRKNIQFPQVKPQILSSVLGIHGLLHPLRWSLITVSRWSLDPLSLEYPRMLENSFYRTFHYLAYLLFFMCMQMCVSARHRGNGQSRGQFDRFCFCHVSPDIKLRLPDMVTSY